MAVNVDGVWRNEKDEWVNIDGVWRKKSKKYTNLGGVWTAEKAQYPKVDFGGICVNYGVTNQAYSWTDSDGSFYMHITSLKESLGGYDGKYRAYFSTPITLKTGDNIYVYGKFSYGNLGATIMFCKTHGYTEAYDIPWNVTLSGPSDFGWASYSSTYTGPTQVVYLHLHLYTLNSYVENVAYFKNLAINGCEILNRK